MKTPNGSVPAALTSIGLGPEIISDFARTRRSEGRLWAEGYTQAELDVAQEKFGLVFPPDLVASFLERRPVLGWDYRSDDAPIREMLVRPLQGLLFDLEHNALGGRSGENALTILSNKRASCAMSWRAHQN